MNAHTFYIIVSVILGICAVVLAAGFVHALNETIRESRKNDENPGNADGEGGAV